MSTNTRETSTDILRNRTPVGGRNMQILSVEFKNGHVVRIAEARRTSSNNLQHGLKLGRRSADGLKNLRCGRLLFLRLVQFTAKPLNLSFLTSNEGTTTARSLKVFALRLRALVGLLLALERRRIAHPKGLGLRQFSKWDYSRDLLPVEWG